MKSLKSKVVVGLLAACAQIAFAEELETARWQSEIDRVAAAGGGVVKMPAGRHLTGTIYLKSGVTLELEKGCILEGSSRFSDYPDVHIEYAEIRQPWQALVVAEDQHDVAVVGEGEIFGNGKAYPHGVALGRPRGIIFLRCRNVSLLGIRMRDLANWTCYLKECDGVTVRGVTVDSHANSNNDGIDIDSRNVLVENCSFDSDDDGIVFKSDNPDFIVENVIVRNCSVRSVCSAIKLGTGSHGGFRNILVENVTCTASERAVCDPKTGIGEIAQYRVDTWPGSDLTPSLLSAIAVECVDGGIVDGVTVRNVTADRAASPIFIRGGLRYGRKRGDMELGLPFGKYRQLKNVTIENFVGTATSYTASSITGVPGLTLENVTLRNVLVTVPGAGEKGAVERDKPVPERSAAYPESNMFDKRMLPAYGLYVRHVKGLSLENVKFAVKTTDCRPEIVTDDVELGKRD